jgi:hypothetical protein
MFLEQCDPWTTQVYRALIEKVGAELPDCHIRFTRTQKPRDCWVKVRNRVAVWFYWQPSVIGSKFSTI